jgi:hypothetical protein
LRCAFAAASGAPANSMALGAPPAPSLLIPMNLHDHSQEALSALGSARRLG